MAVATACAWLAVIVLWAAEAPSTPTAAAIRATATAAPRRVLLARTLNARSRRRDRRLGARWSGVIGIQARWASGRWNVSRSATGPCTGGDFNAMATTARRNHQERSPAARTPARRSLEQPC
jgi:hypothetical protein